MTELIDKLNNLDINNNKNTIGEIETNNNTIWEHILNTINYKGIDEKIITSKDIKNARDTWKGKKSQFEPRLLCKHDTYDTLPYIFKTYNICIISIKNGEYLLTKTHIYYDLRYSGLFESKEYLNEPILFGSLLNGRHRCNFSMKLGDKNIDVKGSQYETDGCYESENKIIVIECKTNKLNNFNIRQLYYPYRTIYNYVKDKKEIITLFITTYEDIIYIWKIIFTNPLDLTSIKCISYNRYKFIN